MMRRIWIIMFLFLEAVQISANDNSRLYQILDSLIEQYDQLTAEKERRVATIKEGVRGIALTPEQQYDLNQRLYDEYVAYKFDSAFYYIDKNVTALRESDDRDRFAASAVRMAHILSVTGLFDRARRLLDQVNPDSISDQQKIAYYTQQSELNLYRSEMAQSTNYFSDYIKRAQYYRQLAIQIAPKDSYDYVFNKATYICEAGETDQAIQILEKYMVKLEKQASIQSVSLVTISTSKQDGKEAYNFTIKVILNRDLGLGEGDNG